MAKKTTKKNIYQPDDRFFKFVMRYKENAKTYLESLLKLKNPKLDFDNLELRPESHVIPNLKIFDSDLMYRCPIKNSEEALNIVFLWENKSEPDNDIIIQIGLYLFLTYYKMVKTKGQKLEPIIAVVFYNGKEDWTPPTLQDLLKDHPLYESFKDFIPHFEIHFTNIRNIPREELLGLQNRFFRSAMIAMANRHDWDLLLENLEIIFSIDENNEAALIGIGHYVFGIYERQPKEVKENIPNFETKSKNNIMTTLEQFKLEGKIEGKIEGMQRAIKFMEIKKDIETVLNLLSKAPNLSIDSIKVITGVSLSVIRKIQKGFEKGNEKTARKTITEMFANFAPLEKIENQKLEELYMKFLPKFQKKK